MTLAREDVGTAHDALTLHAPLEEHLAAQLYRFARRRLDPERAPELAHLAPLGLDVARVAALRDVVPAVVRAGEVLHDDAHVALLVRAAAQARDRGPDTDGVG